MPRIVDLTIATLLVLPDITGAASKHFLGLSSSIGPSLDVPSAGKVPSVGEVTRTDEDADFSVAAHSSVIGWFSNSIAKRFPGFSMTFLQRWQQPPDVLVEVEPITLKEYVAEAFFFWSTWAVLALLAYFCCYRPNSPLPQKKEDAIADPSRLEDLISSGHWQCLDDSSICVCSFLCPSLRWSDTTSLSGFLSFSVSWGAFTAVALLNCFTTGVVFGLFSTVLLLYFRHQLRDKLGVESWTFGTCCRDFCYICWCPCCAIAQEARIVKEAIQMGHESFPAPATP